MIQLLEPVHSPLKLTHAASRSARRRMLQSGEDPTATTTWAEHITDDEYNGI